MADFRISQLVQVVLDEQHVVASELRSLEMMNSASPHALRTIAMIINSNNRISRAMEELLDIFANNNKKGE